MSHEIIPVKCKYIKPGEGYEKIVRAICKDVEDGDIVVISETPISTAEANLVDEDIYEYGTISFIITEIWCRLLWAYVLGPLLRTNTRTIRNLKKMPVEARKHKQFILEEYGLKYALQPTAEAGVDLSNVPGTYVSPLPENPNKSACIIKNMVKQYSNKNVDVMIVDTDPTYRLGNILFTTLPQSVEEIKNSTGIYGYILRSFAKKMGVTPLSSTGKMETTDMIRLGNLAEKCQREHSENFFETVYNMNETFNVNPGDVDMDMLKRVTHIPAVIIRGNYL